MFGLLIMIWLYCLKLSDENSKYQWQFAQIVDWSKHFFIRRYDKYIDCGFFQDDPFRYYYYYVSMTKNVFDWLTVFYMG